MERAVVDFLLGILITALFAWIAFYDIRHRMIRNISLVGVITIRSAWLAAGIIFYRDTITMLLDSLITGFAVLLVLLAVRIVLVRYDILFGDGDIKYLCVLAFCLGVKGLLYALSVMLSVSLGMVIFFSIRGHRNVIIPGAPLMSFGAVVSFILMYVFQ